MSNKAVTESSLGRLVWFLNLKQQVLQHWNRADDTPKEPPWDSRWLYWNTSEEDDSESLIQLQADLRSDINGLLNTDLPPSEALNRILDRIDALKLAGFRSVLTPEKQIEREIKGEPFTTVTLIRVAPPAKDEKGRRKPITETVNFSEHRFDEAARSNFYRIADDAIRNDTISDIRCCLHCGAFFRRSKVGRLTYCSSACETKFNNERRIKNGYFTDRPSSSRAKKRPPAKQGYDVFLQFRSLVLQGPKTSLERDRAGHVASWLHFDRDSLGEFERVCQKLNAEAHWRSIKPFLKKRFDSYAAVSG